MTFTPGITSKAERGLVFSLSGQNLYVTADRRIPIAAATPLYLGELDDQPCFAALADEVPPPAGCEPIALRQLFGTISDHEFGVAGRALGLTAWDHDHRFCGRCGQRTEASAAERVRTCSSCGSGAYPRLSPAVIMLVERDGTCLLARNARTRMPFFSTLAGFVEVGETLEHAVAREVKEEAGIEIRDIRYFGSQPWPFTGSLMIGFTAKWASGELHEDPTEIVDAGWFARDAIPVVPPKLSIARELIDAFVGGAATSSP